jgi:hypothetical protein
MYWVAFTSRYSTFIYNTVNLSGIIDAPQDREWVEVDGGCGGVRQVNNSQRQAQEGTPAAENNPQPFKRVATSVTRAP